MIPLVVPLALVINLFRFKVMGKVFDFYQYQFLRRRDFGKNVIEDLPRLGRERGREREGEREREKERERERERDRETERERWMPAWLAGWMAGSMVGVDEIGGG